MANPQLEDGFTMLVNDLMQELWYANLNGTQFRILLFVIRSTYGYQRKAHDLSISFMSKGIGIDSRQMRRELKILIEMNIINVFKEATFTASRMIGINKNHSEWILKRHQESDKSTEGEIAHTTEGFTMLSNELMQELWHANLNGTQFRILLFVIRSTYGYQRKAHDLSISFMSKGIEIDSRQMRRELKILIEMNIINVFKEATSTASRMIGINKNHSEWILKRHQESDKTTKGEIAHTTEGEIAHTTEGELTPQKRKDKEKIKKNVDSADILFEKLWREYPIKQGKSSISKTTKKKLETYGEDRLMKAISNYKKYCEVKKSWYQPMNGSTFFNGRYEDYLDENNELVNNRARPKFNMTIEG